MSVSGYLHIAYHITDVSRSRRFYEALGLEWRGEGEVIRGDLKVGDVCRLGMSADNIELELICIEPEHHAELSSGFGHIAIGVDDLDETLARLKKLGVDPEPDVLPHGDDAGSRSCFVKDPNWYRVKLVEKTQLT